MDIEKDCFNCKYLQITDTEFYWCKKNKFYIHHNKKFCCKYYYKLEV